MINLQRYGWLAIVASVFVLGGLGARPSLADEPSSDITAAFEPFEHLIGSWKGSGIPTADRIRGWPEQHAWSWVFDKGNPIGLSVEMTGDQTLKQARLTFDSAKDEYELSGEDPSGQPFVFRGKLDQGGRVLVLERQEPLEGGVAQRLTFRLMTNKIRYVIWDERHEPGSPRFSRFIDVNMGKEGETFAAGSGTANLPQCILTGGAATMSVTYQGKSYPVCCTGCRDEFQADPERYAKKAAERADSDANQEKKSDSDNGISRVGKDDGSFDALLDGSPSSGKSEGQAMKEEQEPSSESASPSTESGDTAKPSDSDESQKSSDDDDKAAELLKRAQDLEKRDRASSAVIFYRIILEDHPQTPQAKTAAERLKALGK